MRLLLFSDRCEPFVKNVASRVLQPRNLWDNRS